MINENDDSCFCDTDFSQVANDNFYVTGLRKPVLSTQ